MYKPMKAISYKNVRDMKGTYLVSEKLDGIRAIYADGRFYSSSGKEFPNVQLRTLTYYELQRMFDTVGPIDGELFVNNFQNTQSVVMSNDHPLLYNSIGLKFYAFDLVTSECAMERYTALSMYLANNLTKYVKTLPQTLVAISKGEAVTDVVIPQTFIADTPEGYMFKRTESMYKQGPNRSKDLIKMKFMEDMEALVIGVNQYYQNDNPSERNEHGYLKKATNACRQTPMPWAGSLEVLGINGPFEGVIFNVGSGLTHDMRVKLWNTKDMIINNMIVKIKYQGVGADVRPRIPVYMGERLPE